MAETQESTSFSSSPSALDNAHETAHETAAVTPLDNGAPGVLIDAAAPTPDPLRVRAVQTLPRWDLFCRVIDNHGDLGVCLRLGRDLASRGVQVRMWCDDPSGLRWMQPTPVDGLTVRPWSEAESDTEPPADVVIETFGCELPEAYLARMARREVPPVWINLEYLSAERYVERSHGLQSPQFSGGGAGLNKWFFYPGFTAHTGGLLREPGLAEAVARHDGRSWLGERGWAPDAGERVLCAFTYPHAPWDEFLAHLGGAWLLLLCPGSAQQRVPPRLRPGQRCIALPYVSQTDFDRLLWSCDLNLVRGEDSFVRAQWAGRPMLWQIYFQDDGAHGPKLEAFLDQSLAGAPAALQSSWRGLSRAWNGLSDGVGGLVEPVPASAHWADGALLDLAVRQAQDWRAKLMEQPDLVTQLMGFALGKAGVSG
ncbi:hypothetical protein CDN98_05540 [Roseateles terrae]|nr:hypothetical protein CDN98_05540 [Roseateles terrae]